MRHALAPLRERARRSWRDGEMHGDTALDEGLRKLKMRRMIVEQSHGDQCKWRSTLF
jgi:phosphotransacetylase